MLLFIWLSMKEEYFNALEEIRKILKRSHPLSKEEQMLLMRQYKLDGCLKSKQRLISTNLRLVFKIAHRYANKGIEIEELFQEGVFGLNRAIEKFDLSTGNVLSTYAIHWIRQSVTRYITDKARLIRNPVHMQEKFYKVSRLRSQFNSQTGREPTVEETAVLLDIPVEDCHILLEDYFKYTSAIGSLDFEIGEEGNSLIEFIVEEKSVHDPDLSTCFKLMKNHVKSLLLGLNERSSVMIQMYYGLNGHKQQTLQEIGSCFGLTRERVRQLIERGMTNIKKTAEPLKIRDYLDE